MQEKEGMRLDKWLWVARFYKTRGLACEEVGKGRVMVNGQLAKPSKELHAGDLVALRQGPGSREIMVVGLSNIRGPAPTAQALYEETAKSVSAREQAAQARRDSPEPSASIEHGRPTKRDRRQLADWDRWSVSLEPDQR